jgi:hypothetical protein
LLRCGSSDEVFDMVIILNDYYVITSRRGEYPDRWSWEIRRKSNPLGIKMTADGFQSEMAAQFEGKRALADSSCFIERRKPRPQVRPPQLAASFIARLASDLLDKDLAKSGTVSTPSGLI